MDILKEISNTQKEDNEELFYDKHSENLAWTPKASHQIEKTSDINSNNHRVEAQESNNLSEDIKHNFDLLNYKDSQVHRKYSLRVVKPIVKPFQLKIKMRERYTKYEKYDEPPEKKEQVCKVCFKICKTYLSYMNHMRQHSSTVNTYICAQCDEPFSSNKELWNHKMKNHREANCFLCQKCQLAFSDHYTYLLHTVHHMKKPYHCPECHVTSITYKSLAAHMKTHFNPLVKCHLCNKEVFQRRLQMHLKSHQDTIKCVECGKEYKDNKSYKYHLISHTGVKPHQCLYCGKAFSTSSGLKVHTTLHTGIKPFQCDLCSRQFRQLTDLNRHKEGHDTEGRYECNYCGKKFKGKESLKYHIRSHTNYKPYECPNCKISFTTLVHLRSHISHSHIVTKEYICETCKVAFHVHHHYLRHLKCKRHLQNVFSSDNKVSISTM